MQRGSMGGDYYLTVFICLAWLLAAMTWIAYISHVSHLHSWSIELWSCVLPSAGVSATSLTLIIHVRSVPYPELFALKHQDPTVLSAWFKTTFQEVNANNNHNQWCRNIFMCPFGGFSTPPSWFQSEIKSQGKGAISIYLESRPAPLS